MKNIAMLMFAALLLAGCAAAPQPKEEAVTARPAEPIEVAKPPVTAAPATGVVSTAGLTESAIAAQQQGLQDKSIYFDFDQFIVKPEYRDLLRQHVAILQAHPKDSVTLEGNADERGSSEYNLAIGNKRANAVKVQMVLLGIAGSRIHLVSLGEEKPRATCHDESCWQQNRRVDFAYRSNNQ
jgi:peptidoglycan-associated lipoprotein